MTKSTLRKVDNCSVECFRREDDWVGGVFVQAKLRTAHRWRRSPVYKYRQRTTPTTRLWRKWRGCCS